MSPVICVKGTIQKTTTPALGSYDPVISNLTSKPYRGEKSFAEVRDEYADWIQLWVDELNKINSINLAKAREITGFSF